MSALYDRVSQLFISPEHRITTNGGDSTQILFCSPGLPVSQQMLEFGGWYTPREVQALSHFSRVVNMVPNAAGRLFSVSGSMVWDVYDAAVSHCAFPNEPMRYEAMEDGWEELSVPEPAGGLVEAALAPIFQYFRERRPADAQSSLSAPVDLLPEALRNYAAAVDAADDEAAAVLADGPLLVTSGRAAAYHQRLKARLDRSAMTDRMGPFWPTPLVPADLLSGGYRWEQIAIHEAESAWLAGRSGWELDLTAEVIQAPLLRAWWDPTIFRNRGWRWATPLAEISDGGSPPRGMMPLYITSVIFARNLTYSYGTAGQREDRHAPDPQILGFICERLPKCPNPDLTLDWPKD